MIKIGDRRSNVLERSQIFRTEKFAGIRSKENNFFFVVRTIVKTEAEFFFFTLVVIRHIKRPDRLAQEKIHF